MRRGVSTLLRIVPFDALSRRAVEESLRDWSCERENARSRAARVVVHARHTIALLRVVCLAPIVEARRVPLLSLAPRLTIAAALFVIPSVIAVRRAAAGRRPRRAPIRRPIHARVGLAGGVFRERRLGRARAFAAADWDSVDGGSDADGAGGLDRAPSQPGLSRAGVCAPKCGTRICTAGAWAGGASPCWLRERGRGQSARRPCGLEPLGPCRTGGIAGALGRRRRPEARPPMADGAPRRFAAAIGVQLRPWALRCNAGPVVHRVAAMSPRSRGALAPPSQLSVVCRRWTAGRDQGDGTKDSRTPGPDRRTPGPQDDDDDVPWPPYRHVASSLNGGRARRRFCTTSFSASVTHTKRKCPGRSGSSGQIVKSP